MGKRFTQTILINTVTDQVWTALIDVMRWPEWTPTVLKMEPLTKTPFGVSARYRITQPKLWPVVYEVNAVEMGHAMKTLLRPKRKVFSPV